MVRKVNRILQIEMHTIALRAEQRARIRAGTPAFKCGVNIKYASRRIRLSHVRFEEIILSAISLISENRTLG